MVIKTDEKTIDSFMPFIHDRLRLYVRDDDVFCLGCIRDDTAAGILIFSVENGVGDNREICATLELRWLYTDEAYRRQGVAEELMEALYDIYEDSPAEAVTCYIPQGMGYEYVEAYFETCGFEFETDLDAMIINKDDCRQQIKDANKKKTRSLEEAVTKPEGVVSVGDIPKIKFKKAIDRMTEDKNSVPLRHISNDRDLYDGRMSFAFMRDNEISSVVLFERRTSNELRMVLLRSLPSADPKDLLALLHYSAGSYYLNESEEAVVWFTLGTTQSLELAKHIFPDKEAVTIHTGYYR